MKVTTTKKEEITVMRKLDVSHVAHLDFDTMVVSSARYDKMRLDALLKHVKSNPLEEEDTFKNLYPFTVEKSKYLVDDIVTLKKGDKTVAHVNVEDDN